MAIMQVTFNISEELLKGIFSGELNCIGGTVRCAQGVHKGQIKKLLKPAGTTIVKESKETGQIIKFLSKNKTGLIIVGATLVITGGTLLYNKYKKSKPEVITECHKELNRYLSAVNNGCMSEEKIIALINVIDKLKAHKDYKKMCVKITGEELYILANQIHYYTMKLARENNVELSEDEKYKRSNIISELHKDLKMQKRVFSKVA